MSHQPYPQQPGWGPPQQQPGWGAPPPPPPRKSPVGKIIGLGCAGIFGLFVVIGIIATLVGSGSTDGKSATAKATTTPSELTDEERASIRAANGLPPTPKAAEWSAYIKALDAIDPDIVHGKEDKAVSRGIDTCSAFKRYPDDPKQQVEFTGRRFTSPAHPEGRDTATAKKILNAAHKHICPGY